ncbi:uncharacterized protein LOC115887036 [Sitophilus oryzae]|nr:uncharacterized protein LOC115887036 [Sitophilus oryzae]
MEDILRTTGKLFKLVKTQNEVDRFLKLNKKNIKLVLRKLKVDDNLTFGEKLQIENALALLKSYNIQIQRKIIHGSGVRSTSSSSKRILWKQISSAFQSRIITASIVNISHTDTKLFLNECSKLLKIRFKNILRKLQSFKVNLKLCCLFELPSTGEEEIKQFGTVNKEVLSSSNVSRILQELQAILLTKLEEFEHRGSGWRYLGISHLIVSINKYSPINGATYVSLPSWLSGKGIVNIKNNDSRCFAWCILAHLFPVQNDCENVNSYPQNIHDFLNFKNIEFPVALTSISKFEKQNPNISINVFGIDNKSKCIIGPYYHTKIVKEKHINLLYLISKYQKNGHYCLITDLSKLVKEHVTKSKSSFFVCELCLNHFSSEKKYQTHRENCLLFSPVKVTTPSESDSV